jgi:putative redox protein
MAMTVDSQTETPNEFRQIVRVDAHTLHADVSDALGGKNSAPGPHDYFDIALATCKALTATWYARMNGLALERVEATVERDASKEREGIYTLRVTLALFGNLPNGDKRRIAAAVAHCPIHKLMTTATIVIETAPLGD